jgi:hypothetical protein
MQQENRDMMPLPAHESHEEAGEDASIVEEFSSVLESA